MLIAIFGTICRLRFQANPAIFYTVLLAFHVPKPIRAFHLAFHWRDTYAMLPNQTIGDAQFATTSIHLFFCGMPKSSNKARLPFSKEKLQYVLLESLLIVLGVVLAYSVNEYREHRRDVSRSQQAMRLIHEEFAQNKEILTSAHAYHAYLIDTLKSYIGTDRQPGIRVFHSGFTARNSVLTSAWETAKRTESLSKIPMTEMLALTELYQRLESYNKIREINGQLFMIKCLMKVSKVC
ncbi:MAG: hypothetical protein H6695_19180 [Deferribacteres bacterium]|nr:hypothetical protein [Deferribacteres bacterium]